ncbi:UNVERIFIED_CONTAM: hypothetical protein Sindi_1311900 [Sesamum indicum]
MSSSSESSSSSSSDSSSSRSLSSTSTTSRLPLARKNQVGQSARINIGDPEVATPIMTLERYETLLTNEPWLKIESTLHMTIATIRTKYHIPQDFEIILPSSLDRMNQPPLRSCPIYVVHLDAGLSFSLPRPVGRILSRLEVCPMQLAPNSIHYILVFIIVMNHLGLAPNFDNFWSLHQFMTSKRSGDSISLLNRTAWPFPCEWRTSKPEPKACGGGG